MNYNNQLTQVLSSASTTVYAYDHAGERIKYTIGTTTTISPNRLYDTTGSTKTQHIYADDQLVASIEKSTATTTHFVHNDHLTGSNVQSKSDGTSDEVIDYLPFGKVRLDQASTTFREKRKYTGHEYDVDTELTYAKARYYSGNTGRFVSQDPMYQNIGAMAVNEQSQILTDPQGLNSYSYVLNNPLRYKDPTGEKWQDTISAPINATLGFIAGSVAGTVNSVFHPIQTVQSLPGLPAAMKQDFNQIKNDLNSPDDYIRSTAVQNSLLLIASFINPELRVGKVPSVSRFIANAAVEDYGKILTGTVDLKPTLERIAAGERLSQFRNDGTTFLNNQGLLPRQEKGYYTEFVHQTPGIDSRQGPQRVVTGKGGEVYYSPDHYKSFIHLNGYKK